ncbi:hypothetical protein MMPV_006293 [Pyropia vietnamensis]
MAAERTLIMLDPSATRTLYVVAFDEKLVERDPTVPVPSSRPVGRDAAATAPPVSDFSSCSSASSGEAGDVSKDVAAAAKGSGIEQLRSPPRPAPSPPSLSTSVTDFSGLPAVLTSFFCGTYGPAEVLFPGVSCLSSGYQYVAAPLISAASQAPLRATLWQQLHLSPAAPLSSSAFLRREGGGNGAWRLDTAWRQGTRGSSHTANDGSAMYGAGAGSLLLLGSPPPDAITAETKTARGGGFGGRGGGSSGGGGRGGNDDDSATGIDERRRRRNRAAATRANERRKWLTAVLLRVSERLADLRSCYEEAATENAALRMRAAAAGLPLPPIIGVPPDVMEGEGAGAAGIGEMDVSTGDE